jgi:Alw26I/Eco31I/Esp3I family type II restriction endonuclease
MENKKKIAKGRGKFTHSEDYLDYKEFIVNHPNYASMPGARYEDGRIRWQCSSGKTTSFYEFYQGRVDWWTDKANKLGLPGHGKQNGRWTTAARLIHPTGVRRCLICGEERQIGYFYVNSNFEKWLNRTFPQLEVEKLDSIAVVLEVAQEAGVSSELSKEIESQHPERSEFFKRFGMSIQAFKESQHLPSPWLTPGYMGDPPHRFDGLHDYCNLGCRKTKDPGRSDSNLASYFSDRRAYEWWSEGEWALADSLYRIAGPGICRFCGNSVAKVSPDHIGPLACGFKHLPLFQPLCSADQSSKNRRMRKSDVDILRDYEIRNADSVASWQVRALWDANKELVQSDDDAEELSAALRSMQDEFFRFLGIVVDAGFIHYLATLLNPDVVMYDAVFIAPDPATFNYESVTKRFVDTSYRRNKRYRIVRIAFESLYGYLSKGRDQRSLRPDFHEFSKIERRLIKDYLATAHPTQLDAEWKAAVTPQKNVSRDEMQRRIEKLMPGIKVRSSWEEQLDRQLRQFLSKIGSRRVL